MLKMICLSFYADSKTLFAHQYDSFSAIALGAGGEFSYLSGMGAYAKHIQRWADYLFFAVLEGRHFHNSK